MDNNRRKYVRANYPCQLTIWQDVGLETILANTSNIGAQGIGVIVDQEILAGTKVDVQIYWKELGDPFRCKGIVVYNKKREDRFYHTGIQFVALSLNKTNQLNRKILDLKDLEKEGK
ncbi:MAG: PilZ domain-containing protein [Candidatus Omnitrophica bacterium]|nr:PilZ domain-containing protein [Candidatus Omnitrophota bacterium]